LPRRTRKLLARRDDLQAQIDKWHRQRVNRTVRSRGVPGVPDEIGYLQPEPADFTITTSGVDAEITTTAGPQLCGADPERAVRAERVQRPGGDRCTTRCTAPT